MSLPLPEETAEAAFSAADSPAWEAERVERHEYLAGEVFAMAGASDAHVTITGNIFSALRNHLRGGPCQAFFAGMKLNVAADDAFFYPDVFVTCAESDRASRHFKQAPILVVEVLSPGTEAFDRGGKFAAYRQVPDLQEYLLVDGERLSMDLFRRGEAGQWVLHPCDAAGGVYLESVDLVLSQALVYEDVEAMWASHAA